MTIDFDLVKDALEKSEEDAKHIEEIVDNIVNSCCDKLDNYIEYVVKDLLNQEDYSLTNAELDDIIMTIPTMLYFVGTQQEKLGVKRDVSKQKRSLVFNEELAKAEGTQGLRKAFAENKVFYETMVTYVFENAYDIISSKVSAATEVLQSAKKIMSRRITETELSKITPNKEKW
ncbi:MAG: hypothetical protein J6V44_15635 [Methanobrevibacter sp.]|nr:hypothetical protein [Methanobrevibacter sp.]MBO7692141.1 hypothetical protein [Methanobrevibacter sp.]